LSVILKWYSLEDSIQTWAITYNDDSNFMALVDSLDLPSHFDTHRPQASQGACQPKNDGKSALEVEIG
jgi:hypothetical protein